LKLAAYLLSVNGNFLVLNVKLYLGQPISEYLGPAQSDHAIPSYTEDSLVIPYLVQGNQHCRLIVYSEARLFRISQRDKSRAGPLILLDDDLESLLAAYHVFIFEGKQG
jgi:hypothetical protein